MIKEIIPCRECRYFEQDHFEKLFGVPVIVAHNICKKFDIATNPEDGYCFLAKKVENAGG